MAELSPPSINPGDLLTSAAISHSFEREAHVMTTILQRACILSACMVLSASVAGAQQDSSLAELRRQNCAAASAGLRAGRADAAREAMLPLNICGVDAAPVLASAWLQRWGDADILNRLMAYTARQTDPGLFDVLATVSGDARLPTIQRAAALFAMASYADPSISGRVRMGENGEASIGVSHGRDWTGPEDDAMRHTYRRRLVTLLESLKPAKEERWLDSAIWELKGELARP